MKNKVLVELVIPVLEEKYDVYIPLSKKVGNILNLIVKAVGEMSDSFDIIKTQLNLYNGDTGQMLDRNQLFIKTNIKNGSRLILM